MISVLKNSKKQNIPQNPGVYFFYNSDNKIIYIGKAKNLKIRIKSYFQKNLDSPKTKILVDEIHRLEYQVHNSEIEAIISESLEIKKHLPKYNIKQKDDKTYSYIGIIKRSENKVLDFPQIQITRDPQFRQNKYFGPFTNSTNLKQVLKFIRKIIPYCTNKKYTKRACFGYYLDLCPGICTQKIAPKDYQKNIKALEWFFSGKTTKVRQWLEKEMQNLSKQKEYEKAAQIRDRMELIDNLHKFSSLSIKKYSQDASTVKELYEIIGIKSDNFRIEAYDISNISGTSATGSTVVFENGKPDKKSYRKFKIKSKSMDDYNMMQELLSRRFTHSEWKFPGLIVLDGGRGQLSVGLQVLRDLSLEIPISALAKKFDVLYIPHQKYPIYFPKNSQSKFLLQNIRDEAHRFAKKYHTNLRDKTVKQSALDDIKGLGPKTKIKLLKHFGSVEDLKKAKISELKKIVGNDLVNKITN
ncbi:MAG: excinuclease ABC subunit UvrC [bacterium]